MITARTTSHMNESISISFTDIRYAVPPRLVAACLASLSFLRRNLRHQHARHFRIKPTNAVAANDQKSAGSKHGPSQNPAPHDRPSAAPAPYPTPLRVDNFEHRQQSRAHQSSLNGGITSRELCRGRCQDFSPCQKTLSSPGARWSCRRRPIQC
jgi:hypothetical protein